MPRYASTFHYKRFPLIRRRSLQTGSSCHPYFSAGHFRPLSSIAATSIRLIFTVSTGMDYSYFTSEGKGKQIYLLKTAEHKACSAFRRGDRQNLSLSQ
jgi:hypothetical protein